MKPNLLRSLVGSGYGAPGVHQSAATQLQKTVEEIRAPGAAVDADGSSDCYNGLLISRPSLLCGDSVLEESVESISSSIPGVAEAEACDDHGQDDNIQSLGAKEAELIEKDHDESADSGIDQTLSDWRSQEKESPNEKRSRFNRFIPSIQAPRFWRTPKAEASQSSCTVTRTLVMPAAELDSPPLVVPLS